jgi:hypothetical protein
VDRAIYTAASTMERDMMSRIWRGWTAPEDADIYETLLETEIFPGIFAKGVAGLERIELFRRNLGDEVEFVTVMWFTTMEAVKAFAGDDHETAYVPAPARAVLARFDARSQHYEVRAQRIAAE